MRSSAGAAAGERRSASPNQCAALAGARRTASSPASRRTATAPVSPSRAERSTWWARAEAVAPRAASAVGAALVGAQPPAGRRGVVDRAANERMPETEAPGHVGRAQEIEPQQLVDRRHTVRLGKSGRGRGQLGLEGVAGHSRSFQHEAFRAGQQRELFCQRRGDDRRHADRRERTLVVHGRAPGLAVGRPRELLEVEGIAATLQVERVRVGRGDRIAQELTRLLRAERAAARCRVSRSARQARSSAPDRRSGTWRGRMASARSTGAAGGRRRSAPSSSIEAASAQCKSSSTSTSGCARRKLLEQRAHGAVAAITLVLERHPAAAG